MSFDVRAEWKGGRWSASIRKPSATGPQEGWLCLGTCRSPQIALGIVLALSSDGRAR